MIKVMITGATGKMGMETVRTVWKQDALELVACLGNKQYIGEDIGSITGLGKTGVMIETDLDKILKENKVDLLIDLTHAAPAVEIISSALEHGVSCISGSTGFSQEQLDKLRELTETTGLTTMIIPNFSIGAVLMMLFSQKAGKYFENVEIIEMHHEKKKDFPSGTAIKTAEMLSNNEKNYNNNIADSLAKIEHCRGGQHHNINIHSIRMPGFVATQEVIFGGLGQTLSIKHSTINREAFMPGIVLAIRKSQEMKGFIYGLENLLD